METKKKNKKKDIFIIVSVILAAVVALGLQILFLVWIFSMNFTNFEIKSNGEVIINDGDLTISKDVNSYYNDEDGCYHLESKLINNTDDFYEYIDITYTFYDNEDYILGNGNSYLERINSNGKWKFDVTYCGRDADKIDRYELSSIDLF